MNCSTHQNRSAVYECDNCGQPICESCYNNFELPNGSHVCSNCYKEAVRGEIAEVSSLKGMIKRELIFIIIGMVLGLGVAVYLAISLLSSNELPVYIFIPIFIYLPFIFGSLLTIVKKVIRRFAQSTGEGGEFAGSYMENDGTAVNILFNIVITVFIFLFILFSNLIIAPITTIIRIVQRVKDSRQLNSIAQNDQTLLVNIDEYIAQSTQPSTVAASASGEGGDVEISLEAILAAGGGSDAALCDNGEILRTVRTR